MGRDVYGTIATTGDMEAGVGARVGADATEMCLEVCFSQHMKFCFPEILGEAQPTTM